MNKADRLMIINMLDLKENGDNTKGEKVRPKYKDGVESHTIYLTHICETYDLEKGELPITTYRPIAWKSGIKEVFWIYQDASNSLDLLENKYDIHWWNEWDIGNRTIGNRYGETVRRYKLMDNLLYGLKNHPYTRRHVLSLYQYENFMETKGLYPCAFQISFSVRHGLLDMTLFQRSSDYLTANHINKIQYVALQMMIARHCGLKVGKFTHYVENLHIYNRHIEQMEELLKRQPSNKQPKLILKEGKTNFYEFTIDDFEMIDYEPVKPQLKFELAI